VEGAQKVNSLFEIFEMKVCSFRLIFRLFLDGRQEVGVSPRMGPGALFSGASGACRGISRESREQHRTPREIGWSAAARSGQSLGGCRRRDGRNSREWANLAGRTETESKRTQVSVSPSPQWFACPPNSPCERARESRGHWTMRQWMPHSEQTSPMPSGTRELDRRSRKRKQ
jgi:hypothetical protein